MGAKEKRVFAVNIENYWQSHPGWPFLLNFSLVPALFFLFLLLNPLSLNLYYGINIPYKNKKDQFR